MTGPERGFLLLTSHLGNPERRVLTTRQLHVLSQRVHDRPAEDRELTARDFVALGYGKTMSEHMAALLSDEALLDNYINKAKRSGCQPITRATESYPILVRRRLGYDSPGCLWAKGDLSILQHPAIALVGSRELKEENRAFARAVGREAAEQGLTLVSGNARGADRAAQEACLAAGGRVISLVADNLAEKAPARNLLYLSEEDYDMPFSAQRALSRNRVIHCLGALVFAAQSSLHQGGTWDGCTKNLQKGWSPVAVFRDGSEAAKELEEMGAYAVGLEDLKDMRSFDAGTALMPSAMLDI